MAGVRDGVLAIIRVGEGGRTESQVSVIMVEGDRTESQVSVNIACHGGGR